MPIHDPIPPHAGDCGDGERASAFPRLTPRRLREWVRGARPGARIVYSRGSFVDQHADRDMVVLARKLGPNGDNYLRLHLSRPKPGGPIDYLAVRTAKPIPPGVDL